VEELSGEKIDIVRWSDNPAELCGNALNPADILDMTLDEENKVILVIVPHDQLSLAIGKKGQNARLASKLVGWTIDIRSDVELATGEVAARDRQEAGLPTPGSAELTPVAARDSGSMDKDDE
jgi:N utilization substance protein A